MAAVALGTGCSEPLLARPLPSRSPPVARRREAGTPAAELKVGPSPVTPAFLQRSPQISAGLAQAVVAKLREGGFIDEAGMLVKDPRSGGQLWRDALQPVVGGLSLEADKSAVAEVRRRGVRDQKRACGGSATCRALR